MNDDGTMARVPELRKFARKHGLLMITIADLIQYRMRTERLGTRGATGDLPTARGARARTCSPGCTQSACPAPSFIPHDVIAERSSIPPWRPSRPRGGGCCCI